MVTASLTTDDEQLLRAIADEREPDLLARRIHSYYRSLDRADRTPRRYLYFHLGLLSGALVKFANQRRPHEQEDES